LDLKKYSGLGFVGLGQAKTDTNPDLTLLKLYLCLWCPALSFQHWLNHLGSPNSGK